MGQVDVVIIGGGIAGLTSAAYLAQAGLDVQLIEQHDRLGGYVSSFARGGFIFPAGPTSFGSNGIVFPILEQLGLSDRQKFARANHQLSWDAWDIALHSPKQARDAMIAAFPQERRNLRRFFRWVRTGGSGFNEMIESGLMFGGGKGAFRAILRLIIHNPLYVWAAAVACRRTNGVLYARFFRDSRLRRILNQLGHPVMDGWATMGLWGSFFHDYHVPVGGMQSLADNLAECITRHHGRIRLGQRVARILVSDGAAAGVLLSDGVEIRARWVLSGADLRHTLFDLIGDAHISPSLAQKLARGVPSGSIFSVFLGLDDSPEALDSLRRFQSSHVWFTCADGSSLLAVLLSKDDPSVAPPGRHALWLGRLSPYEDWEGLAEDDYRQRKKAHTADLISHAEELIPNLRRYIAVEEAASPSTYHRYTGNWQGAVSGWSWDPEHKQRIDLGRDLNLGNFFCVGHWLHTPAGVPAAMITAWYVAQEVIKRNIRSNTGLL